MTYKDKNHNKSQQNKNK